MNVDLIPTRNDNYVFVLSEEGSPEVAIVDPSDFAPVESYLVSRGKVVNTILVTHHHPDHVGGIAELKAKYNCRVVAAKQENHRIQNVDHWVEEGDEVFFKTNRAVVLETPGHTLGHNAYHFADHNCLFSGDTLFSIGCGRLFEGSPKMMMDTLNRLARLPEDTVVYCTHEYTLANLEFARDLEPENEALKEFGELCKKRRELGKYTVPTTIGLEKKLNPFLRVHEAEVKKAVNLPDGDLVDVFAEVRRRKDHF
ncbi:MAG: hydroxyacylglutathione hydrolase [Bdellovibrionales bacterium]|nr:hydroxyacylglutathione hydrolase [Bdellovibrionales bacterium]